MGALEAMIWFYFTLWLLATFGEMLFNKNWKNKKIESKEKKEKTKNIFNISIISFLISSLAFGIFLGLKKFHKKKRNLKWKKSFKNNILDFVKRNAELKKSKNNF